MSTYNYKELVRRGFEEGINQQNFALFEENLAPNYVNHNMPAPEPGPTGLIMVVKGFFSAFPDFQVTVEDIVAEGDLVSTRGYFTGTHQGEFQGIPATGKAIKAGYIDIWRGENGKLVENWVQLDIMALLQQLGAIPAPAQTTA
jgi:predicted ester cyclase